MYKETHAEGRSTKEVGAGASVVGYLGDVRADEGSFELG